jgi:hypothetical protein
MSVRKKGYRWRERCELLTTGRARGVILQQLKHIPDQTDFTVYVPHDTASQR